MLMKNVNTFQNVPPYLLCILRESKYNQNISLDVKYIDVCRSIHPLIFNIKFFPSKGSQVRLSQSDTLDKLSVHPKPPEYHPGSQSHSLNYILCLVL